MVWKRGVELALIVWRRQVWTVLWSSPWMWHTSVLPSRPARPLSVAALWNLITTEHADVLDDRQMIIQCPRTRSLPYLGKDTLRICQHPFLFTRFHYIITCHRGRRG